MDKCREEFEKQKYWIGLFRDAVDFDEELGRYVLNGQRKLYAFHLDSFNEKWAIWQEAWQHQQAKVEELEKQLREYIFVAETIDEMYVKEVKSSEELQKRVGQQGLIIAKAMSIASDLQKSWSMFEIGKKLEQALKGDQYDEHRKKAEEAISKGASLTNHRIEL
ncbi:hypothetical protein Q5X52_01340 [Acinetobacter baumannii]|nr:hypothetical protein [Acinetobacter baumannii]